MLVSKNKQNWVLCPINGKDVDFEFVIESVQSVFGDCLVLDNHTRLFTDGKGHAFGVIDNYTHIRLKNLIGNVSFDEVIKNLCSCNDDADNDLFAVVEDNQAIYFYNTSI